MNPEVTLKENIYGHLKRLEWIISHLRKEDTIVELGCGTGTMITLPLLKLGYQIMGVDPDQKSISFGKNLFRRQGIDPKNLRAAYLPPLGMTPDVIIASEVIEHLSDEDLPRMLEGIRNVLRPGGKLLATVPNGNGWFEIEKWVWFRCGIGRLIRQSRLDGIQRKIKHTLLGAEPEDFTPSTLSASPHVQRFTFHSIQNLFSSYGFSIIDCLGSVLIAGPFSNLFFTGIRPMMRLNNFMGSNFPKFSAGFFVGCRLQKGPHCA